MKIALTNARLTCNAVDLSTAVRGLTLSISAPSIDSTTMGAGWQEFLSGLPTFDVSVEFAQDYAGGSVNATLFALIGQTFAFAGRAVNAAISATNPEYQGNVILTAYQPIGGSVAGGGSLNTAPVTLKGTGALTMDITP